MIPIRKWAPESSTGNIFRDSCLGENFNIEAGITARNRPVAASLVRMLMASA
jgi:hypothetical protein